MVSGGCKLGLVIIPMMITRLSLCFGLHFISSTTYFKRYIYLFISLEVINLINTNINLYRFWPARAYYDISVAKNIADLIFQIDLASNVFPL